MQTNEFKAVTTLFRSDINDAHYHNVTFTDLEPNTIYAYLVTVKIGQNTITLKLQARTSTIQFYLLWRCSKRSKTHWSRVFREAFRDAPEQHLHCMLVI